MKRNAMLLYMSCLLLWLQIAQAQEPPNNTRLHQLFDDYYRERMPLFPTEATAAGYHQYDDQLAIEGAAPYLAATRSFYNKYLTALQAFDRKKLRKADRVSYDILVYTLQMGLEGLDLHLEYLPMNQFVSTPLELASFGSGNADQPFNTVQDYERWAKRMNAFPEWTDTCIANFNKGIRAGVVLPKALVMTMIPQLEALTVKDAAKNVFYLPLAKFPASFTTAEKQRLTGLYHQVIADKMIPAYEQLATYLKNIYLSAAQEKAGLYALPGGDRIYAYYLHYYTTAPELTPEQVYQTGLTEVARIRKEMEAIKTQVGFTGTLPAFFTHLKTNPALMPFKTPAEVLAAYRQIHDKIQPALAALFGRQPQTRFEIRRVEAFREAAMGGPFYVKGNPDEKRPATFYVPVPDATKINVTFYGMEATFIHEGVPGHHFQIALQQENKAIPAFRRQPTFSAYFEGWALYAESLGKQLHCYTDPYQQMGALNNEIHRAIRLVTDVAIHTGKMTRAEAIAYMMANEAISETIATAEVERYMALPGQALSYKTGEIKLMALRDKLARQMGPRFHLKDFHDALLAYGDMPLKVLEEYMNDWARTSTGR
ncbi:DUF885 domain-containing protein [Chitinophaga nivalis]|uniref:DUF885 domain-containing protein n=1 Tax=Chitinophaga nivalis TaxID=2991709 RepID=A0ABT3IR10_9BACT|nr:DUF885 domain-containing protein [Chitinophaga nivalis]MCW3463922.1 DUF885 domain-containing protein [Chitinophaga nivalis]MCW3486388.1 DUF885 domain-containing protein [Chitinophaga nivalis]